MWFSKYMELDLDVFCCSKVDPFFPSAKKYIPHSMRVVYLPKNECR